MNENEFDLDFDFEKEYGFDLPKEDPMTETDEEFDLESILAEDFGDPDDQFAGEYSADFDYGPEAEPEEVASDEPILDGDIDLSDIDLSVEFPEEAILPEESLSSEEPVAESEVPEIAAGSKRRAPVNPMSNIKNKLLALIAPVVSKQKQTPSVQHPSPAADGKPRKPISPMRKFKNETLPLIILGVSALLILIFIIGSIGRAVTTAKLNKENQDNIVSEQQNQTQLLEAEAQRLMDEAALIAAGYDYQGAIDLLNTFTGDLSKFPDISQRKSEYEMAKSQLVAHNDPSEVLNLSFHVLIADPSRAFTAAQYGGSYNKNFVTTDEFEAILEQLYANDYVLVDFDSFIAETSTGDSTTYESKTLYLPDGKKPLMITETYGYLQFMVDSNEDGEPDANGGGFATRLVVDANGEIKAEMVDASGNTVVGNYALVPILNDFIAKHPDFSYQGARAILATTGYNGVFGYRIQKSVINDKGQAYYDEQVEGAKKIVEALRAEGYTIACYTYENVEYGKINSESIQTDLNKWNQEIASVIGAVDTLVYAKESDISTTGAYSGSRYTVLSDAGFRYFITSGNKPSANVAGDYVRQVRVMVTGANMAHAATMYSNYFDAKAVLNTQRGNVPTN